MREFNLKDKKELKEGGRGSLNGTKDFHSYIIIVKWFDYEPAFRESIKLVKESSSHHRKFHATCYIEDLYNKSMGRVDLFDRLYQMDQKSSTFYIRIFF